MRGRPEQEVVRIHEQDDNSTRIAPLNEKQIEKTGVDTNEPVYCKREPVEGKSEIRLKLSNDKNELLEEDTESN